MNNRNFRDIWILFYIKNAMHAKISLNLFLFYVPFTYVVLRTTDTPQAFVVSSDIFGSLFVFSSSKNLLIAKKINNNFRVLSTYFIFVGAFGLLRLSFVYWVKCRINTSFSRPEFALWLVPNWPFPSSSDFRFQCNRRDLWKYLLDFLSVFK